MNGSDDFKELEKGVALADLHKMNEERDSDMEFRLLKRLNCHSLHYNTLVKVQNARFSERNRY